MITTGLYQTVTDLITDIADTEILTRFHALTDTDITRKHGGDLVTTADRQTERRLSQALRDLLPGSVTVGEESVADNPDLLRHLTTDTPAWIIDPVDGTTNFVNGDTDYCCLVSLSTHDTVHASWIYAPSQHLTAGAHTGHGAWINGRPVTLPTPTTDNLNLVTTHPNYTARYRQLVTRLTRRHWTTTPCRTAGLSYVDVAAGLHDAVVYTWQHPWDHAAGLHLLTTIGGTSRTGDGTPFRISGGNRLPFVAGHPTTVDIVTAAIG